MFNTSIMTRQEQTVFRLRSLYHRYGYQPFKMSRFEEYELYLRNKDFLISDSILTFTDPAGRLMALKPDVTLSIVKNFRDEADAVDRVYYDEKVYRVPRGSQSAKEIRQVGLECMGAIDPYCMLEVINLAVESLAMTDVPFVLSLSHLGIVTAVLEACGFEGADAQNALHWVGEKNAHELRALAQKHGLPQSKEKALLDLVKTYGAIGGAMDAMLQDYKGIVDAAILDPFADLLRALAKDPHAEGIWLDFSVLNDIHYYNGIVFQGYVKGLPDEILSGGQYDGLMRKMGKSSAAVGFAVYLDALDRLTDEDDGYDADILLIYGEETDLTRIHEAVNEIRSKGLCVQAVRCDTGAIRCKEKRYLNGNTTEVADA